MVIDAKKSHSRSINVSIRIEYSKHIYSKRFEFKMYSKKKTF